MRAADGGVPRHQATCDPVASVPRDFRAESTPGENASVFRPALVLLATLATVVVPAPAGAAAVPVLVIDGKGHGHGVGMAQDGALSMGRRGATTAQILHQFYPGTTIGRSGGEVRVAVLTAPSSSVVLAFPDGGEVRDARDGGQSPGFPLRVPAGGSARLRHDGRQYVVEVAGGRSAAAPPAPAPPPAAVPGSVVAAAQDQPPPPTTTTTGIGLLPLPGGKPLLPLPSLPVAPLPPVTLTPPTTAPATTAPPATAAGRAATTRSLWAVPTGGGAVGVAERGHKYRGVVQAVAGDGLRLVNHVDVEQYLRGMGEVRNPSWPAASLRAQAIAARTYAMRAMAGGGDMCDTQQCQVYLGAQAEYAAMDKAVAATRGQVLMYRRALAATVYSANGGGFSASTEEGFGTPGAGYPYLRPAAYPTDNPAPWSVTVALRDVAGRLGYRGRIGAVRTESAGPSGRVLQVTMEGTGGVRTVSGIEFDRALGLRSTMFAVRTAEAATAPPAPPPADPGPVQALPDGDAEAVAVDPATAPGADVAAPDAGTLAGLAPSRASSSAPAAATARVGALAWLLLLGVAAAGTGVHFGVRLPGRPTRRKPDAA